MLSVGAAKVDEWLVLRVAGEIDMATAPQLRQHMATHIERGDSRLIVDLAGVEFIDSTGLGVLIGGLKRARSRGGDLKVSGLGSRIADIFELTGLSEVLDVVDIEGPGEPQIGLAS